MAHLFEFYIHNKKLMQLFYRPRQSLLSALPAYILHMQVSVNN